MNTWMLGRFALGIVLLIGGAELLVRGASRLAGAFGISPLVVGLTVVALGTSSPELAVSVQAALGGNPEISIGNVVGSNIFNVLFILGISALIVPLVVSEQLVRLDVPLMIAASIALWVVALDGTVGRGDGVLLLAGIVAYTVFLVRQSRRETVAARAEEEETPPGAGWLRNGLLVAVGLALLIVGSRWLVEGATVLATAFGVSQLVIGLTVVAAGTSLPEVATSVLAGLRGERDIAVGNVVGSNLFNILVILGVSAVVAPRGIAVAPAALAFDIPVMIAVAVACLPIFFTGHLISRWEGGVFLAFYVAYTTYVVLAATQHDALPALSGAMLYFVIPLTTITLGVLSIRAVRTRRGGASV
ncbi:MAG: calcium/sodium antiporter [Gemmatimonadota bacterium]|nr:calcium/sodium antiporter [Gemmatimonadota bacterium]